MAVAGRTIETTVPPQSAIVTCLKSLACDNVDDDTAEVTNVLVMILTQPVFLRCPCFPEIPSMTTELTLSHVVKFTAMSIVHLLE